MAIKFLNKTNTNDISIIQGNVNIGSNDDPDVLLHIRSDSTFLGTGIAPTLKIQDVSGGKPNNYLDITQTIDETEFSGTESIKFTVRRGNITMAPTLTIWGGTLDVNGSVKIADDSGLPDSSKAGSMRYREETNNLGIIIASHLEMCMLIDITNSVETYDWVSIKENTWP